MTATGRITNSARSRLVLGALIVAAVGVVAAAVVSRSGTREGVIPAGTRIVAALRNGVSTERNHAGDRISLTTRAPIELAEGGTVPEGARLEGEVTYAKGGGRIAGAPELTLRFTRIEVDGRGYPLLADPFRVRGKSDALESAAEIGGGAVVGGVIGAVAGSVVKGAVVGAVLGTGVAVATKGNQIYLPAGQRLRITVAQPLTVTYKPAKPEKQTAQQD